ncbi:MAG: hypothetical protein PHW63_08990 [Alphaproteobacteria bacterium]|nr:hypothetical protein [Alphaproteobacteria bacterium]
MSAAKVRWTVKKTNLGSWKAESLTGADWQTFSTHSEAMEYADEKARTVKVVLPPPFGDRWSIPHGLVILSEKGSAKQVELLAGDSRVTRYRDELEDLGAALVAMSLANKKGHDQA